MEKEIDIDLPSPSDIAQYIEQEAGKRKISPVRMLDKIGVSNKLHLTFVNGGSAFVSTVQKVLDWCAANPADK